MTTNINDRIYNSYIDVSRGDTPAWAQRMSFGDSVQIDAFGRIRVSNGNTVFDSYEILGKKTNLWNERTANSGVATHVANQSAVAFETATTNGSRVYRESKKLTLYTPGTSVLAFMTGVMGTGATNSRQRIGLFNDQNGVFFENKDGTMGVVIRSYTSGTADDNRVERSSWNIDSMDGTGPSGINLDFTKTQIFYLDLEWLGVGRVRMGFVHQGVPYICHEFYHNNSLTKVYMSSPLLPVRYEVVNTAASTALTDFRQICSSVIIEGTETTQHEVRTVNNGVTAKATTTTTAIPILSVRLKTAYVGKGMIKPTIIDVAIGSAAARDTLFEVIYGGTLESDSFTDNSGIAAYDVAATHITGGIKLASIYGNNTARLNTDIFDHEYWLGEANTAGVPEILTVTGRSIGGAANVYGTIDYEEFY